MSQEVITRFARPADSEQLARLLHLDSVRQLPSLALGKHLVIVAERPDKRLAGVIIVRLASADPRSRVLAIARDVDAIQIEEALTAAARALVTSVAA